MKLFPAMPAGTAKAPMPRKPEETEGTGQRSPPRGSPPATRPPSRTQPAAACGSNSSRPLSLRLPAFCVQEMMAVAGVFFCCGVQTRDRHSDAAPTTGSGPSTSGAMVARVDFFDACRWDAGARVSCSAPACSRQIRRTSPRRASPTKLISNAGRCFLRGDASLAAACWTTASTPATRTSEGVPFLRTADDGGHRSAQS